MCLLYQCRVQILMLIFHERNLSCVSERYFFLFGCFTLSSQVYSSRSLGKEAHRGSGGTGKKLMVISRKIFWTVRRKIDFARAMLHIKAKDWVFINQDMWARWWGQKYRKDQYGATLHIVLLYLDPNIISFSCYAGFFKKDTKLYLHVFCWSKTAFHRLGKNERRKGKELFRSLKAMFWFFFLITFLMLRLFQS